MMTREQIIAAHPLPAFFEARGTIPKRSGSGLVVCCPFHEDGTPSMSIDANKGLWHCFPCDLGGTIIDLVMRLDGITAPQAMTKLTGGETQPAPRATAPPARSNGINGHAEAKPRLVKLYDYPDENGKLLFQVGRYEPKTFRQRAPDGKGGFLYSLEGVRRVLYNLPKVAAADLVWLCEGEKDADTLIAYGFAATTNAMGAKKWSADYTAQLRGKDVVLLPDNDDAGHEHRDLLLKELGPAAKSIRIVEMPKGVKDVTDFAATFSDGKEAMRQLVDMAGKVETLYRGQSVPVQTIAEMEDGYRNYAEKAHLYQLRLGDWLPSLRVIRPLVPGELVAILGGTGTGKTMILQNIALASKVHTLFIEAELPPELSFERFVAMATETSGGHVEDSYRTGGMVPWRTGAKLDHIVCVHKPRVTPKIIAAIIEGTELKTCHRPRVVLIDYVQLIGCEANSRYERASMVMEEMKIVARETGTVIVIASQVGRSDDVEVTLQSGKDSGSIENSSGVVIGAWRDEKDSGRMWVRVLKNTKGKSGISIPCRIRESLRIREEETKEPTADYHNQ